MSLPFLNVKVSRVIRKRKETIDSVVGESFTMALPFNDVPFILDKTADVITFETVSSIPGSVFNNKGQLELVEQGVKTNVIFSTSLLGLLLRVYLLHWLPAFFLWFFQGLWIKMINPDGLYLIHDWVWVVLLVWPMMVFFWARRRIKLRMMAYLNNLKFH